MDKVKEPSNKEHDKKKEKYPDLSKYTTSNSIMKRITKVKMMIDKIQTSQKQKARKPQLEKELRLLKIKNILYRKRTDEENKRLPMMLYLNREILQISEAIISTCHDKAQRAKKREEAKMKNYRILSELDEAMS